MNTLDPSLLHIILGSELAQTDVYIYDSETVLAKKNILCSPGLSSLR